VILSLYTHLSKLMGINDRILNAPIMICIFKIALMSLDPMIIKNLQLSSILFQSIAYTYKFLYHFYVFTQLKQIRFSFFSFFFFIFSLTFHLLPRFLKNNKAYTLKLIIN